MCFNYVIRAYIIVKTWEYSLLYFVWSCDCLIYNLGTKNYSKILYNCQHNDVVWIILLYKNEYQIRGHFFKGSLVRHRILYQINQ